MTDIKRKMPNIETTAQNDEKEKSNIDTQQPEQENNDNKESEKIKDIELEQIKQKYEEEIKKIQEKNQELERKLMYVVAEYDNIKKRSEKELENANKFAITKFAIDFVKIYDTVLTAVETTQKDKNDENFYNGIQMTINDFNSIFEKLQIVRVNPKEGEKFDHNKHEAISKATSDLDIGCIVKTIRCGYEIYGRLLRPAMVVVSSGK